MSYIEIDRRLALVLDVHAYENTDKVIARLADQVSRGAEDAYGEIPEPIRQATARMIAPLVKALNAGMVGSMEQLPVVALAAIEDTDELDLNDLAVWLGCDTTRLRAPVNTIAEMAAAKREHVRVRLVERLTAMFLRWDRKHSAFEDQPFRSLHRERMEERRNRTA